MKERAGTKGAEANRPGTGPRLRAELEIVRTAPTSFLVMDPVTGESSSFGARERRLMDLLDGTRSIESVGEDYARRYGDRVPRRQLAEFVEQLRLAGWLEGSSRPTLARARPAPSGPPPRLLNRAIDLFVLLFGWALHPVWTLPIGALFLVALIGFVRRFEEFWGEIVRVVGSLPLPLLVGKVLLTFLSISFYRSLVLAIACRKFGGNLRSFRVRFLRTLIPCVRCDPGERSLTMSPRGRATMVYARYWALVLAWSLLVLGWLATEAHTSLNVILLLYTFHFSIGLAFQSVFLLKTDAYGMLSHGLRLPWLWDRSRAEVLAWLRFARSPEALGARVRFWMRLYGLAALVVELLLYAVVLVGGPWLLIVRFDGPGAALALFLLLWWFLEPRVRGGGGIAQAAPHPVPVDPPVTPPRDEGAPPLPG